MVTEPSLEQHSNSQEIERAYSNSAYLNVVTYNKNALNNLRRAVVLGEGQFSLILARANYQNLQHVLLNALDEHLRIKSIALPPNATRLRDAMLTQVEYQAQIAGASADYQVLMVTGLECIQSAEQLAALLKAANLGRDELPKSFDTPVVLWVNDAILQQLNKFAPDLKSFAATPIRFEYPLDTMVAMLKAQADYVFRHALGIGDETVASGCSYSSESEADADIKEDRETKDAIETDINLKTEDEPEAENNSEKVSKAHQTAYLNAKELPFALTLIEHQVEHRAKPIDNGLVADLLFLQGRNLHGQGEYARSRSYYEGSLTHWRQQSQKSERSASVADSDVFSSDPKTISVWDRQAVLLFYLGLWWRSHAVRNRHKYVAACEQARDCFESCIDLFRVHRPDRAGHFMLALAEVLQKLTDWPALKQVATEGLTLHAQDPIRLARDYGYLAEVAIAQYQTHAQEEQLKKAQTFAEQALDISERSADERLVRYHRAYYLYLLAIAQQHQHQPATALQTLARAKAHTDPRYDLSLYRSILDRLWHLYFEQKHYAQAFDIKLAQRRVESLFGLRAFIGAGQIQLPSAQPSVADDSSLITPDPLLPSSVLLASDYALATDSPTQQNTARILAAEIKASGREQDINALINRLSQPRYPIVVIHGQSGVGKSSTISAGLMPRLSKLLSEGRTTHPIMVNSYSAWRSQIASALHPAARAADPLTEQSLTQQIEAHVQEKYQQIVLIFDQFEDFFYEHPAIEQRKALYVFLRDCLEIPYVKVVIALREDFLHYLLEWDRNADLSIINNDVLSTEVRYYLGNFLPSAAERVIRELTQSAGFSLEEALIAALVDDLAAETGDVRPIELQVVGAQLQRENITTLADYRQLGRSPKTRLLQNFLDSVIRDCGPENSLIAQSVLFLLSEGDNRPLKSFAEIFAEIEEALSASAACPPHMLKLVLKILVGSGLLFEVPEVSGVRYQLVHEYLASLIRQQPPAALTESGLVEALKTERIRREQSEDQLREALANQLAAESASRTQAQQAQLAEVRALIAGARSLRLSGDGIGALSQSLRAAQQLFAQATDRDTTLLSMQAALSLDASLREVREKNRLCHHNDWVLAVDCSKTHIISASEDATLKLWSLTGSLLQTLTGHHAGVLDVRFSADGQYIASASLDHTIRLWKIAPDLTDGDAACGGSTYGDTAYGDAVRYDFVRSLEMPAASVTSISFSPIAPLLAATYSDAYIRIWNYLTGQEVHTWEGHEDWVRTVAFSPDGERLVTGGEDQMVRIWRVDGEPVSAFQSAQGWVRSVSWHPEGEMIASAGDATILRLWNQKGRKLKTLYGHEDWVRCVAFSPDGTKLASASDDQTIKIWGTEGTIQQTFQQRSSVHSLAWSADSRCVVSGGDDDLVHIWRLSGPPEPICRAHTGIVWSACWHPRKDQVLSAGGDSQVKLWNAQGELLQTMEGHKRGVHSLAWSPKGDFFASASADGTVRLWSELGKSISTLVGHQAAVWRVCYSPDGKQVASVSSDRTLRLWSPTGTLIRTFTGHTDTVWHVSFSPDGEHLITASEDNTLKLWHVEQGLLQTIANVAKGHDGSVWCAAFSPDGRCLASGDADGDIRLWTLSLQEQLSIAPDPIVLKGHRDWIRGLSFSADGEFLSSASDDGTVRLWALAQPPSSAARDRDETEMLPALAGHDGVVWDVSFDATGARLATAGADGTLRIWDLQLSALSKKGCAWLDDWLLSKPDLKQQICL